MDSSTRELMNRAFKALRQAEFKYNHEIAEPRRPSDVPHLERERTEIRDCMRAMETALDLDKQRTQSVPQPIDRLVLWMNTYHQYMNEIVETVKQLQTENAELKAGPSPLAACIDTLEAEKAALTNALSTIKRTIGDLEAPGSVGVFGIDIVPPPPPL